MSLHLKRRHMRVTAWTVLFAWTFAFFAGLANACLLDGHGAPGHDHEHGLATDGGAHSHGPSSGAHDHGIGKAHDHHDSHATKRFCVKVCDETSQGFSKQTGTPNVDAAPPVPAWAAVWPEARFDGALGLRCYAVASWRLRDPPARVRFSRLVL